LHVPATLFPGLLRNDEPAIARRRRAHATAGYLLEKPPGGKTDRRETRPCPLRPATLCSLRLPRANQGTPAPARRCDQLTSLQSRVVAFPEQPAVVHRFRREIRSRPKRAQI